MVTDVTAFINSTERKIAHNKSRGLRTLFLISISFSDKKMPDTVWEHFSDYVIEIRKCRRNLYDITIEW